MRESIGNVPPDELAEGFRRKAEENLAVARWAYTEGKYQAAANRFYYAFIQAIRARLEKDSRTVPQVCPQKHEYLKNKGKPAIDWSDHEVVVTLEAMRAVQLSNEQQRHVLKAQKARIISDYKPYRVNQSQLREVDGAGDDILAVLTISST